MHEVVTCPLCLSTAATLIEMIENRHINALYEKNLGISVMDFFKGVEETGYYLCAGCDLRFFHPAIGGTGAFYERLQTIEWYYSEEKNEFKLASRYIDASDTILEVGCGKGAFSRMITCRSYRGIEYNRSAVTAARKAGLEIECESVQEHAVRHAGYYNVVCSFQVLEHVPDLRDFILSSVACLKKGGLLIISVPSEDSFLKYAANSFLNMPPHHLTRWSDRALCNLGGIFGIRLTCLEHERVQREHEQWLVHSLLVHMMGGGRHVLERSARHALMSKIASKAADFIYSKLPPEFMPHGHSVLAVYEKTENG